LGLTIVGLMNGVVVGLGAVLFGVPLAGPIAIVTFVTSYIPFFGAALAAPVTAVTLRTIGLLREVGLFEMAAAPSAGAAERPRSQDTHEASTGPTLAD
jgi:hypothetical protein